MRRCKQGGYKPVWRATSRPPSSTPPAFVRLHPPPTLASPPLRPRKSRAVPVARRPSQPRMQAVPPSTPRARQPSSSVRFDLASTGSASAADFRARAAVTRTPFTTPRAPLTPPDSAKRQTPDFAMQTDCAAGAIDALFHQAAQKMQQQNQHSEGLFGQDAPSDSGSITRRCSVSRDP
jgi:hypothetical protein